MKIVKTSEYQPDFSLLLAKDQKRVNEVEDIIKNSDNPTNLNFVVEKPPFEDTHEYSATVKDVLIFITFRIENDQCVLVDVI